MEMPLLPKHVERDLENAVASLQDRISQLAMFTHIYKVHKAINSDGVGATLIVTARLGETGERITFRLSCETAQAVYVACDSTGMSGIGTNLIHMRDVTQLVLDLARELAAAVGGHIE